jgi:fucose permease
MSSLATYSPKSRRWAFIVMAITFLSLLAAAGVRSTPGVLIMPLEHHFGWSRTTISLSAATVIFLYGLVGPFAAALMQSFGIRRTMIAGLSLMATAAFVSQWMRESWQ